MIMTELLRETTGKDLILVFIQFVYFDYPVYLCASVKKKKKTAAREIVITVRSRIRVSEHLPSSLEPALSYACPGDVS